MNNIEKNEKLKKFIPTIGRIMDGRPFKTSDLIEFFLTINLELAELEKSKKAIPYQLCPKCNGQGSVSKPPFIPGDVDRWDSTGAVFPCDVCNNTKIIPMFVPNEPLQLQQP